MTKRRQSVNGDENLEADIQKIEYYSNWIKNAGILLAASLVDQFVISSNDISLALISSSIILIIISTIGFSYYSIVVFINDRNRWNVFNVLNIFYILTLILVLVTLILMANKADKLG